MQIHLVPSHYSTPVRDRGDTLVKHGKDNIVDIDKASMTLTSTPRSPAINPRLLMLVATQPVTLLGWPPSP